jgi:hypothetical protein
LPMMVMMIIIIMILTPSEFCKDFLLNFIVFRRSWQIVEYANSLLYNYFETSEEDARK